MSVQDGYVMWGARVVIPQQCRQAVMQELRLPHPGINHMKSLARSYVWWPPAMDNELEKLSKQCELCQLHSRSRLDHIHPSLQGHVCKKPTKMKIDHGPRKREFAHGDNVYVDHLRGRRVETPIVVRKPRRRHVDHLRGRL